MNTKSIAKRFEKSGSNWNKARLKVATIYEKIVNARRDFLHKLSTKLIHENQVICLEDLQVENMVKNHHLAKSITDASWSEFVTPMENYINDSSEQLARSGSLK